MTGPGTERSWSRETCWSPEDGPEEERLGSKADKVTTARQIFIEGEVFITGHQEETTQQEKHHPKWTEDRRGSRWGRVIS